MHEHDVYVCIAYVQFQAKHYYCYCYVSN